MATADLAGINETWANLRKNPIFLRSVSPRSVRFFYRSPIPRAIGLTVLALAAYEVITAQFLSWWPVIFLAIFFWFLIQALQRYFCWVDLCGLARTGTLDDYLNSGMSRADVALGVIYPAEIAETMAVCGVMGYFLLTANDQTIQVILAVFIFLHLRRLWGDPYLFLPDVESYFRRRNALTLFFISFAVWVPLMIWFVILYTLIFLFLFLARFIKFTITSDIFLIVVMFGTFFLSKWPTNKWEYWRLKRFYFRYSSFDDLFDQYIEQN